MRMRLNGKPTPVLVPVLAVLSVLSSRHAARASGTPWSVEVGPHADVRAAHDALLEGRLEAFRGRVWDALRRTPQDTPALRNLTALMWLGIKSDALKAAAFTDIAWDGCKPAEQERRLCGTTDGVTTWRGRLNAHPLKERILFTFEGRVSELPVGALSGGQPVRFGPRIHWLKAPSVNAFALESGLVRLWAGLPETTPSWGAGAGAPPKERQFLVAFRFDAARNPCVFAAVDVEKIANNYSLAEAIAQTFGAMAECPRGGTPLLIGG